jgi:repressor LexA
MSALTERQRDVLGHIALYTKAKGYPPTRRELCELLEIAPQAIADHLHALERKGAVRIDQKVARGIVVLDGGMR